MGTKIFTITANGDGSFSVQVNYGEPLGVATVHGFKSDGAAETWALNHKKDNDKIVR
jgi:hypothetical protein